jgi:hypothetical protein
MATTILASAEEMVGTESMALVVQLTCVNSTSAAKEDVSHKQDISTPTTTQSAVRQVFETIELLELILLNIDLDKISGLLRLLRVSKTFHNCIIHSPRLRRKLWFDTNPKLKPATTNALSILNPYLEKAHRNHRLWTRTLLPWTIRSEPVVEVYFHSLRHFKQLCRNIGTAADMVVMQPYYPRTKWYIGFCPDFCEEMTHRKPFCCMHKCRKMQFTCVSWDDRVPTLGMIMQYAVEKLGVDWTTD